MFTITIVSCCKRLVVRCLVIIEVLEQKFTKAFVLGFAKNMRRRFCKSSESVQTTGHILNEWLQKFITGVKMNVKVLKVRREQEDIWPVKLNNTLKVCVKLLNHYSWTSWWYIYELWISSKNPYRWLGDKTVSSK